MRKIHTVLGLFAVATVATAGQGALGGEQAGRHLLQELRQNLDAARMVKKLKPPHPDYALSALIGLSRPDVERVLGLPTYCGHDASWSDNGSECHLASPWGYRWGPPAQAPDSAGPGKIVVTAGGPWLLVFDFSSGKVSAALWLDER